MFFKTDFKFLLMLYFRFCPTLWVEDRSVAERADEVWDSVVKVIKHWEDLSQSQRPKNKSYKSLVKHYTDPLMPAKFKFFEYIASVFDPYLTLFQTDAPMIRFMYEQLKEIYDKLLSMVSKIGSLEEASICKKLKASWLDKKEHQLENGLVNVAAATKLKLSAARVSLEKKRKFQGGYSARQLF